MGKIIIKLVGSILALIGVILIYDARTITKKAFSFGDKNEATLGLKIAGYLISIAGATIIMLN